MKHHRIESVAEKINTYALLRPLDVLLMGGTGAGKSSTLNALFGSDVAKVGFGVDPETQSLAEYRLHDFMRFHDSPGLGDGKEADANHSKLLTHMLLRPCGGDHDRDGFIDMVLVILDGGSRDFGTAYRLLETIVLKNITPDRVVVAINQADIAMKGHHWNEVSRQPEQPLLEFLEERSHSVKRRIQEATGLSIRQPVFYSAKYGYNLNALMSHIIEAMPTSRRKMN